ncbi:MAG: SLBB domain-containing protein [Ignavibacteriaceae bacterium]|nr:SLBB domain-containing protein [Ignavibacteriaceae bacterium]
MKTIKVIVSVLVIFVSTSIGQTDKNQMSDLLASASLISVTIGGNFPITGSYSASATERVDQFVTRIYDKAFSLALGNSPSQEQINEVKNQFQVYSLRNVILKRKNGEELKLDLLKFRKTGNFEFNPYLRNDDMLIFPVTDLERNFFSILGAVNTEGKFHFFDGDKLSDAIFMGDGINKAYENVSKAEITRLSYDGEKVENIIVDLNTDIQLKRGDRIRILANETQRKDFRVLIFGEVNMPGYIPIKKENTTVSEVISKAGGFTNKADLNRSQVLRGVNVFKSVAFSEEIEKLLMLRMSTLISEDSLHFLIDEKLRFLRGNAKVDFNTFENVADTQFVLKDGDLIYVPPKIDLVYIYGQVNEPAYVKYEEDKDYSHYLAKVGGMGETASDDIYLIKGKNRSWISADELTEKNIKIEPGDYIWVSKKPIRTFWDHVDRASRVASVIGGIATVILLFIQANK